MIVRESQLRERQPAMSIQLRSIQFPPLLSLCGCVPKEEVLGSAGAPAALAGYHFAVWRTLAAIKEIGVVPWKSFLPITVPGATRKRSTNSAGFLNSIPAIRPDA